jgi:hypothetical protein
MMKNRYLALAGLAFMSLATACEKNSVQDITAAPPTARIRFFNFGVNAPQVNFYANDTKMSATLSATGAESTSGVAYGSVSANGLYDGIAPGTYTLTGKIAAATDKDLSIAPVQVQIADGKWYSYYMSGFYNTTSKQDEAFVVQDDLPAADFNVAYVRFVNAISNSSPMVLTAKEQATGTATPVGAAVAYKNAGTFVKLVPGLYDLSARVPGAAADAFPTRTSVSFNPGRIYSISARGDITLAASTTATNRPFLDNTANY